MNWYSAAGFNAEYSTFESFTTCGGNYSDANGILSSPFYPNLYPVFADCVYLISQPKGTYVNISFLTLDIECDGISEIIELRDGSYDESPLIGTFCGNISVVPDFIVTTQNYVNVR